MRNRKREELMDVILLLAGSILLFAVSWHLWPL